MCQFYVPWEAAPSQRRPNALTGACASCPVCGQCLQRIRPQGGGFSASPVAADGRIYLSSEDGDLFAVKEGKDFALLSTNPMGERLMATPALSDGRIFVRGEHNLFAIGR